jgi:hypothetical protein
MAGVVQPAPTSYKSPEPRTDVIGEERGGEGMPVTPLTSLLIAVLDAIEYALLPLTQAAGCVSGKVHGVQRYVIQRRSFLPDADRHIVITFVGLSRPRRT